jgi:hypothetical protein
MMAGLMAWVPGEPMPMVSPSGAERASVDMAMPAPAPTMFSTTIGVPRYWPMGVASRRASVSAEPPAEKPTRKRIGLPGFHAALPCANATGAHAPARPAATVPRARRRDAENDARDDVEEELDMGNLSKTRG